MNVVNAKKININISLFWFIFVNDTDIFFFKSDFLLCYEESEIDRRNFIS
jgi:hypothetical protein